MFQWRDVVFYPAGEPSDRSHYDGIVVSRCCGSDGAVNVKLDDVNRGVSTVTLECVPEPGYPRGVFFETPVSMSCEGGLMPEGDLTEYGTLGYY